MTKSTITRERAQQIFLGNGPEPSASEERELARMALAAMDSEPVELPLDYLHGHKDGLEWAAQLAEANHPETGDWLYDDPIELAKAIRKGTDMPPVQPVADREPDRNPVLAYADSYRDMAKQGVESVPIWSVITDLERNIAPLYRHAQPALVVPDRSIFEKWWESQNGAPLDGLDSLRATDGYCDDGIDGQFEAWNACRAAMLQGAKNSESRCGIQTAPALDSSPKTAESRCGNSPVIPEGYVMVPMRLTAENGAKAALLGEFNLEYTLTCHECFGEGCEDCSGEGTWTSTMPIDWTTIKEIWDKAINHFAAAPQEVKGE